MTGPGKSFEEEVEREKLHILAINERQKAAIEYVKENEIISRRKYMEINKVSNKTAYLELNDLVEKEILAKEGKGRAVIYRLRR